MSTMKRFFTICIAALLAAASFAQVNLWRTDGYLTQFEKATLDSFTISMINPYTVQERQIEFYHTPTGETRDMFDLMKAYGLVFASTRADDFGQPAACLYIESRGQDFIGAETVYNWFSAWQDPNDWAKTNYAACKVVWWTCYTPILAANYVIATRTSGSKDDNYAVAQAKAMRAFEYMQLAQGYQVAYNESSLNLPCVPLVLDTIYSNLILGQEPATVAQVYAQIKTDLDAACTNLEGYVRPSKHVINQAVAYGLRARYNLLVHNYNQAAADAEQALLLSGATPLSIEEANKPGFTDASTHNVLWANIINEEDAVIQAGDEAAINNWVSHMSTLYQQGYTGVGATRSIASALYNEIPASDVRKGWWLNENLESPLLDAPGYNAAKAAIQSKAENVYVNVKFGTGDGTTSGRAAAAGDWIMMRAEELILLRAEALARAGKDGASVLSNFVKTYRDPNYDINAHGLSVADEIWWQRRVELWGEGFGYFDLMRLRKGITRTNSSNWPSAWQVDLSADDERLPLLSPTKAENYKVLAVWRNGEKDLYNTSYITIDRVDSITLGEARERDEVLISYMTVNKKYHPSSETFTRSFLEGKMGELYDTVMIEFFRTHNVINPITVPLIIEADPVFAGTAFPESISFEGGFLGERGTGYIDTSFVVHLNELPVGTYQFTITIPDEYYYPGTTYSGSQSITYQIIVKEPDEWDEAEIRTGVFVDQTVGPAFGLSAYAWYVKYQVVEQPDGSQKIRIHNPYASVATSQDADGIFDGNPWTEEGDVDKSRPFNFDLLVSKEGEVTFPDLRTYLGIGWSDYTEQCFVDYARGRGTAGTYGRFESEKGKIIFDAQDNSMLFGAEGKLYSIQANFLFYLSKDAFMADKEEPVVVDADITTYEGNWTIKGFDANEGGEVPVSVSANVTVTSYTDEKGQYYAIEGLYPNMPVVYGVFDEETHKFLIQPTQSDPVDIEGTSYVPHLYMFDTNFNLSTSITLDIVPGEGGTLVTDESSAAVGFLVVYVNPADQSDYKFGDGMFDISFEPANAGAPVRKAAGIPAKVAKRNGKQSIPAREMIVKRPAKELVKKNIRLLNSNKEFQKNE